MLKNQVYKILLLTVLAISVIYGCVIYVYGKKFYQDKLSEVESFFNIIIDQRLGDIGNFIFLENHDGLGLLLNRLATLEEILAIGVFDASGKFLISTNESWFNDLSHGEIETLGDNYSFVRSAFSKQTVMTYTRPVVVIGEKHGFVRIHYSLAKIFNEMWFIALVFIALLVTILFSLTVILHFYLNTIIIRPLGSLARAMEGVKTGSLELQAMVHEKNEIGQLAESFNQMTEELKQTTVSRDYVDYILENMLNCLIITDKEYVIQSVNRETLNLLKYDRDELVGKSMAEILENTEITMDGIKHFLESAEYFKAIESNYVSKDRNIIPVLFSSSVIRDKNKDLQGYICVAQDITEIKTLRGFIPICASCKNIRDDKGYWNQVEEYISEHSNVEFSHGLCPDCAVELYPELSVKSGSPSEN